MFPTTPQTELTNEQLSGKSTKNGDDFFTKHGGKVALVGISITVYLVYSFFKGGQLRTEEEEKVVSASMVEPNEINELRLMNNGHIDPTLFEKMIIDSFYHFQALSCDAVSTDVGSVNQQQQQINVVYDTFIRYAIDYLHSEIKHGHILDRIALSLPESTFSTSSGSSSSSSSRSSNHNERSTTTTLFLPLHLQLVMLSAALPVPALERAHQLFTIAACLRALQLAQQPEQQSLSSPLVNQDTIVDCASTTGTSLEIEEVPWNIAEILLQDLVATSQIPSEKLVCETGVKYPWRTYRRKTPVDMVQAFKTARKIDEKVCCT